MPETLGPDRRTARANADALFGGLATRFDNVQRVPKFYQARSKLGRYALSPSGVYGDTSVWTAMGGDSTRTLTLLGTHTPTGYLFGTYPSVTTPHTTGDAGQELRITTNRVAAYEWS